MSHFDFIFAPPPKDAICNFVPAFYPATSWPKPQIPFVEMRFHKVDQDSWYDEDTRSFWMQDDPQNECTYDWNLWQIYDDHAQLIRTAWWWGLWEPAGYTLFDPFPITGLEVVEEGRTYPLNLDELLDRIRESTPHTTFYYAERWSFNHIGNPWPRRF